MALDASHSDREGDSTPWTEVTPLLNWSTKLQPTVPMSWPVPPSPNVITVEIFHWRAYRWCKKDSGGAPELEGGGVARFEGELPFPAALRDRTKQEIYNSALKPSLPSHSTPSCSKPALLTFLLAASIRLSSPSSLGGGKQPNRSASFALYFCYLWRPFY